MTGSGIGAPDRAFALRNARGAVAEILTFGARIHRLVVPDRTGRPIEVLAGFDDISGYRAPNPYFNAIVGRTANRIGGAEFALNGVRHRLRANEGANALHGGMVGFDRRTFVPSEISDNSISLTYVSPDGEENFPGELTLRVTYALDDSNALSIEYLATSAKDTPFNPTNHAYFNLDGDFKTVMNCVARIDSTRIAVPDPDLVCRGATADISGTAFDFSAPARIGAKLAEGHALFARMRGGYDVNYALSPARDVSEPAARVRSDATGIVLETYTDRPCLQFYTGNFLDGSVRGRHSYGFQSAFCLEAQGYPNACNVPTFPSNILRKGETFRSFTRYGFSTD